MTSKLQSVRQTKVKMILRCMMTKTNIATGEETTVEAAFNSDVEINLDGSDVNEMYERMVDNTRENLAAFQMRGSNWVFASIVRLDIHTVRYEPLRGSSYIPLPKKLASKKAIINVNNEDDECFRWVVTRALNPVEDHPQRITNDLRKQAQKYNWSGVKFPTTLKVINKFERQNPAMYVNVCASALVFE